MPDDHDQDNTPEAPLEEDTAIGGAPVEENEDAAPAPEADTDAEGSDEGSSTTDSSNQEDDGEAGEASEDAAPEGEDEEEYVPAKRYKDLQRDYTKKSQRISEIERELGSDFDLQQVKQQLEEARRLQEQMQQRQQEQEAQQLPPHDPRSPYHQQWQGTVSRVNQFEQMLGQATSDEQRNAIAEMFAQQGLTQQEIVAVRNWRQMQSSPEHISKTVQEQVEERISAWEQQQAARAEAMQFLQQDDVRPVVEKYGPAIHAMVQSGSASLEDAVAYFRQFERENVKKVVESDRKAASAQALRQASKKKAVAQRDTAPGRPASAVAEARRLCQERGVPATGPTFMEALLEVQSLYPDLPD